MGIKVLHVGAVNSTNDYLKKLVASGAPHKTAVVAETQKKGRGRQGKTFISPPGGIYLSVYYEFLGMRDSDYPLITPAAAVCAAHAIEAAAGIEVGIKWVNDIYYEGKKVCGILSEKINARGGFIVGVGINLSDKGIPRALRETAGYINADKAWLLKLLLETLNFTPASIRGGKLLAFYRSKSILTGKNVAFERNGARHTGVVLGIDEQYRLKVATDMGAMTLDSGEVSVVMV